MKKILFNQIRFSVLLNLIVFHLLICLACKIYAADTSSSPEPELFTGNTMGTTYHIKVVMRDSDNKKSLSALIDKRLKQVNQSMSVYLSDSEISLFNKAGKGEAIKISPDFYAVMVTAQKLYHITGGAWDGTVKPLVDLWGFGTTGESTALPSSEMIRAHLKTIGFHLITIKNQTLQKQNSAITLDLGSIAKGFGVDAIAQLLINQGYTNFLVEIGGEVIAAGKKMPGKPWMVGISKPEKGGNPNVIYRAFPLKDKALATSGDYRHFTMIRGKSYSHIINPATGYPVDNGVVSVSVIADTCTFADGLATALMVMGPEKGIPLVNSLENTECLIVVRDGSGRLTDYKSDFWTFP